MEHMLKIFVPSDDGVPANYEWTNFVILNFDVMMPGAAKIELVLRARQPPALQVSGRSQSAVSDTAH